MQRQIPAWKPTSITPIRVHRSALRKNSGVSGEHRGGPSEVHEYEILEGKIKFTHRGKCHYCAARGYAGGSEGAMSRSVTIRICGDEEVIRSKLVTELRKNDPVVIETAGGAGYGAPSGRSPKQLQADIRDGKIREQTAKKYTD